MRQVAAHVGEQYSHHLGREPHSGPIDTDGATHFRVARVPHKREFQPGGFGSAGRMEAWICRGCGFTEFYTIDVAAIPIDGAQVIAVSATDRGPFR